MTSNALGNVLNSFSTSMTNTQSEMTDLATMNQMKVRSVDRMSRKIANESIDKINQKDYYIYSKEKTKRIIYNEWYENKERKEEKLTVDLLNSKAHYVAMHKQIFGEGAERFAYLFFELDNDSKTIVGNPLVAKESRYEAEHFWFKLNNERARIQFANTFCKTQQLARRISDEFNDKVNKIPIIDKKTPKVMFLDCSIYQLDDDLKGKISVLVEEKLDHTKWQKWNSNHGYVQGYQNTNENENNKLEIIEENEDELDENSSSNEDLVENIDKLKFTPCEVAQAFYHFSYWATGKKRLICDLQGVYDENDNVMKFSDPVIHYYSDSHNYRKCYHGRSDLGYKGMVTFFNSHRDNCNKLCKLVTSGFKKRYNARRHENL